MALVAAGVAGAVELAGAVAFLSSGHKLDIRCISMHRFVFFLDEGDY